MINMKHRCGVLLAGVAATAMILPQSAFAQSETSVQDEAKDEQAADGDITVVGSRIAGRSFEDVGSPVLLLGREDLLKDNPGGSKVTDILQTLPQNVGVFRANSTSSVSELEGNFGGGSVNLRGLGSGATLVLVNGRRQTRFPLALDNRTDVNSLFPSIALERAEVLLDGASAIYGTDAVAGVVDFRTRDNFKGLELKADVRGSTDHWNTSSWNVAAIAGMDLTDRLHFTVSGEYFSQEGLTRFERGLITGPEQSYAFSSTGFPGTFDVPRRNAAGQLISGTTRVADPDCGRVSAAGITTNPPNVGTDVFLVNNQCLLSMKGQVIVGDETRGIVRASLGAEVSDHVKASLSTVYASSKAIYTQQPTAGTSRIITVPGENPGNTFRAVNASGQPLFAAPDPNSPSRPLRNAQGQVVLTSNPTDPASGIAFNEDVIARIRPVSTAAAPYVELPLETETFRTDFELKGDFGSHWNWEAGITYSRQTALDRTSDWIVPEFLKAINGRGGPNDNQYFNAFGNSLLAAAGSPLSNDPAVTNEFLVRPTDRYRSSLLSLDATISSSELFNLPAGPVGLALGVQYRRDTLSFDYNDLRSQGVLAFNSQPDQDFTGKSEANAVFAEAAVPLVSGPIGKIDLSVAGRYEHQSDAGDTFNPKVSLLYATDLVRLRASYGKSFLAPSLFQRFGSRGSFVTINDPVLSRTDQPAVRIVGSDNLKPQTSNSYNLGLTLTPAPRTSFSVDYWRIDFLDLLTTPSAQLVVNQGGPNVVRDPATNRILLVQTPFFNASSIKASGIDFGATTSLEMADQVRLVLSAAATWTFKYDLRALSTSAVVDGVGDANTNTIGYAMPEWRGNIRSSLRVGSHDLTATFRYVSKVRRTLGADVAYADPQATVDLDYRHDFQKAKVSLAIGVLNLFNNLANPVRTAGNEFFIATVQDPSPRRVYVSITTKF